jgi:hypothetical protein
MTEKILLIASLFTALSVIVATAIKVYKFVRKCEIWVEETSEHSLDNYMSILQLKIMSPYMPLTERIKAGDKYVKYGGNGEIKHKYQELLEQLPDENDDEKG